MNRYHRALACVVLLGAVAGTAACSEDSPSPTPAATTPTATPASTEAPTATATTAAATSTPTSAATATPTATPTPTSTEGGGGAEVQAPIGGFVLPTLTVERGTTVIWSNQDGVPHTATADDGEFNSGILNNQTFRHTFEDAGTFSYFCEVHPSMTGTITVN